MGADIDMGSMPTDLAEALALVVRDGRAYGVTMIVKTRTSGQRVVEAVTANGRGDDVSENDLIDALGRRWIVDRWGKYVDPANPNLRRDRSYVEAIRPSTCDLCGALVSDDSKHRAWHREQETVNRMVVRGVWAKLKPALAEFASSVPPAVRFRAARRSP